MDGRGEPDRIANYAALFDFGVRPASRAAWVVRLCITGVALVVLGKRVSLTAAPMFKTPAPSPVSNAPDNAMRFDVPENTRRAIFADIAQAEKVERARAIDKNTWGGHLWSREDDRGYQERALLRQLARRHRISLTQAYLILDEGIRSKWLGPDGVPLTAMTPPLNPRSTW